MIVLLGGGAIGRAVLRRLSALGVPVTGFADSGGAINASGPIDVQWIIKRKKESNKPIGIIPHIGLPIGRKKIVVDCTASDDPSHHELLVSSLDRGASVVLANKHPVAGSQCLFDRLIAASDGGRRLRYESTAGACTPFLASLRRLVQAGERPRGVRCRHLAK